MKCVHFNYCVQWKTFIFQKQNKAFCFLSSLKQMLHLWSVFSVNSLHYIPLQVTLNAMTSMHRFQFPSSNNILDLWATNMYGSAWSNGLESSDQVCILLSFYVSVLHGACNSNEGTLSGLAGWWGNGSMVLTSVDQCRLYDWPAGLHFIKYRYPPNFTNPDEVGSNFLLAVHATLMR